MARRLAAVCGGFLACLAAGLAQPPAEALRYKWQPGQVLTYKVQQTTRVQETAPGKGGQPSTAESKNSLSLTRRWTVKEVDPAGTATLEMAITQFKSEVRQPDGDVTARDSADPEHAKEMAEYLNRPVVTVRIDSRGRLAEVKEAKGSSAARLHAELPFRLVLPETGPAVGQSWDRTFSMKLDPPLGLGESYDFVQTFTGKGVKDGLTAVGVGTVLNAPPKTAGEQVPLVPLLWAGEVYFDAAGGAYHAARLTATADLPNHQGDGTRFVYHSTYAEDAVK